MRFVRDELMYCLDGDRPARGVAVHSEEEASGVAGEFWARLFEIEPVPAVPLAEPGDVYQRADTLFASYTSTAREWPVTLEAAWSLSPLERLAPGLEGVTLMAMLSVRTDEPECHPQLLLKSSLPADTTFHYWSESRAKMVAGRLPLAGPSLNGTSEPFPAESGCVLFESSGKGRSWLFVAPRCCACPAAVESRGAGEAASASAAVTVRHTLFDTQLERGVIVRSLLAAVVAKQDVLTVENVVHIRTAIDHLPPFLSEQPALE